MKYISVAIDGPSGAGKSQLLRVLPRQNSAMYMWIRVRCTVPIITVLAGACGEDTTGIIATLPEIAIQLTYQDGAQHVLLNGEDVSEASCRTPEISYYASKVSAVPEVFAGFCPGNPAQCGENSAIS